MLPIRFFASRRRSRNRWRPEIRISGSGFFVDRLLVDEQHLVVVVRLEADVKVIALLRIALKDGSKHWIEFLSYYIDRSHLKKIRKQILKWVLNPGRWWFFPPKFLVQNRIGECYFSTFYFIYIYNFFINFRGDWFSSSEALLCASLKLSIVTKTKCWTRIQYLKNEVTE